MMIQAIDEFIEETRDHIDDIVREHVEKSQPISKAQAAETCVSLHDLAEYILTLKAYIQRTNLHS